MSLGVLSFCNDILAHHAPGEHSESIHTATFQQDGMQIDRIFHAHPCSYVMEIRLDGELVYRNCMGMAGTVPAIPMHGTTNDTVVQKLLSIRETVRQERRRR